MSIKTQFRAFILDGMTPGEAISELVFFNALSQDELDELIRIIDYSRGDLDPELSTTLNVMDSEM